MALLSRAEEKYKAEKQPQLETLASFFVSGCKGLDVLASQLPLGIATPQASLLLPRLLICACL